jgi:hypothetical protein
MKKTFIILLLATAEILILNCKGEIGPQGQQGVAGPNGPQGVQGVAGATGATGAAGINGTNAGTVISTQVYDFEFSGSAIALSHPLIYPIALGQYDMLMGVYAKQKSTLLGIGIPNTEDAFTYINLPFKNVEPIQILAKNGQSWSIYEISLKTPIVISTSTMMLAISMDFGQTSIPSPMNPQTFVFRAVVLKGQKAGRLIAPEGVDFQDYNSVKQYYHLKD